MALPDVNDYSAAFQHPSACLADVALRTCSIRKNPLGQPRVRSGGFALTYNLYNAAGRNWAVRCFHRDAPDRDRRYGAISKRLQNADVSKSGYFIDFEFQPQGLTMPNGGHYPIVKMSWAKGETMGSFLADNYGNRSAVLNLRAALGGLARFLRDCGIAHGDIQPGNVMVSEEGKKLQLIDYDGMYVRGLEGLEAAEIGLPNFQHPERKARNPWNASLDNFSFLVLDIALTALADDASLWVKTQSGDDKILFSAQDYEAPHGSAIFNQLKQDPRYSARISKLQQICADTVDAVPTLENLDAYQPSGRPVLQVAAAPATGASTTVRTTTSTVVTVKYDNGGVPVVRADSSSSFVPYEGKLVEAVGTVTGVKTGMTRNGRPYAFINFRTGRWSPNANYFELVVWEEALEPLLKRVGTMKGEQITLATAETRLVGVTLSITGILVEHRSDWKGYDLVNYQIAANDAQITVIDQKEMAFRLGGARQIQQRRVPTAAPLVPSFGAFRPAVRQVPSSNNEILQRLRGLGCRRRRIV